MTTKKIDKALTTTNEGSIDTVDTFANTLAGSWEVVETAGASQWVALVEDPEPFELRRLNDSQARLENVVEGLLLGKEYLPDSDGTGERGYYKIQLTRPALVAVEKDATDWAPVGTVVNLGERARLAALDDLCELQNGVCHVLIHAAEKVPGKNGKTLWTFNIAKRIIARATEGNA